MTRAVIVWDMSWDWSVPIWIGIGLALVWYWDTLRESIPLHATIGGAGSLVLVSIFVTFWIVRELRGTVHGVVPFGSSLTALSMIFCVLLPSVRDGLIGLVVPDGGMSAWVNFRDPVYDLPAGKIIAGVLALLAVGTVAFGARLGMRNFASPPEVTGEVPFTIGADGRRIDIVPQAPWTQLLLGWAFWCGGVLLLLFSTHVDALSLVLTISSLVLEDLTHFLWLRMVLSQSPTDCGACMSARKFQEQGQHFTTQAVAKLKKDLRDNDHLMGHFSNDSLARLWHFKQDGGTHFQHPPDEQEARLSRCTVL